MGTPFKQFSNLELHCLQGSGTFVVDPDTGNRIESTVKKIIFASVEEVLNNRNDNPAKDAMTIYFAGYFTKPKFQPNFITFDSRVEAYLIDLATKKRVKGEFLFDLAPQSRFKAVTKVLGNELRGWFIFYG